jgi:hypothetical protein
MSRSRLAVLCATGLAAFIAAGSIAPAYADDHDRERREWREHERHEHERHWHPAYEARPVYAPPTVYAPAAPVYAPPVAPSLNVIVPLRF